MKSLIDELRVEKDKNLKLKETFRNLDRNSKIQQQRMVKLEETIRELKIALKQKRGGEEAEVAKPYHLIKADEKIEELTRATVVLTKAKDKDMKAMKMQKKSFEKIISELKAKIQDLEYQMKDKDKEIKIQAIKIKEIMSLDKTKRSQVIKRDF